MKYVGYEEVKYTFENGTKTWEGVKLYFLKDSKTGSRPYQIKDNYKHIMKFPTMEKTMFEHMCLDDSSLFGRECHVALNEYGKLSNVIFED